MVPIQYLFCDRPAKKKTGIISYRTLVGQYHAIQMQDTGARIYYTSSDQSQCRTLDGKALCRIVPKSVTMQDILNRNQNASLE